MRKSLRFSQQVPFFLCASVSRPLLTYHSLVSPLRSLRSEHSDVPKMFSASAHGEHFHLHSNYFVKREEGCCTMNNFILTMPQLSTCSVRVDTRRDKPTENNLLTPFCGAFFFLASFSSLFWFEGNFNI